MKKDVPKKTIGRAEIISFPKINVEKMHARVDSGARTSAIWASNTKVEDDGRLAVVFFGPGSDFYTGEKHYFNHFSKDIVISSNGQKDLRFKIKLSVIIAGRKIKASFTLADRSTQVYPVLIGRNVLRGKFIVDVEFGKTLAKEERALRDQKRKQLMEEEKS